ncbi:MAG: type II toxin-antitoxin system MqsA family antitoxin [Candidatus Omnitrophota bacterium]
MTYDDCSFCRGKVSPRIVQKDCWWGERLIAVIDNVPAGVCEQCGERYYKADTLKNIEAILKRREEMRNTINLPLADFAADIY